jgi:hypothetical protein
MDRYTHIYIYLYIYIIVIKKEIDWKLMISTIGIDDVPSYSGQTHLENLGGLSKTSPSVVVQRNSSYHAASNKFYHLGGVQSRSPSKFDASTLLSGRSWEFPSWTSDGSGFHLMQILWVAKPRLSFQEPGGGPYDIIGLINCIYSRHIIS